MKISFAWGGCGNLFQHCLFSNTNFEMIMDHYNRLTTDNTWTNQEWPIRSRLSPDDIIHDFVPGSISLAWEDSKSTAFYYCVKNPEINHLPRDYLEKTRAVLWHTHRLESRIRTQDHVIVDRMIGDMDYFMERLNLVDPMIQRNLVTEIFKIWKHKTALFFDRYSEEILERFQKIGVDFDTKKLHNLIYENIDLR